MAGTYRSALDKHPFFSLLGLGASTALCFAPWFLWLLFGLIYGSVFSLCESSRSLRRNVAYGAVFGLGMYVTNFYWLHHAISLFVETNLPVSHVMQQVVTLAVLGAFYASLALPLAIAFCLYYMFRPYCSMLFRPWVFAALVVVAELCRGAPFWPFLPWNMSGYGWANTLALLQLAAWVGVVGMSVLVIGLSAMTACRNQRKYSALVLVVLILSGHARLQLHPADDSAAPQQTIRMVQLNHGQEATRSDSGALRSFLDYWSYSRLPSDVPLAMIVWPEGAAHFFVNSNPAAQHKLGLIAEPLVFGGLWEEQDGYFNTTLLKAPNSARITGVVKKRMVVPVAEDMPLKSLFAPLYAAAMPKFHYITPMTGNVTATTLDTVLGKGLVLNCYEAIFSRQIIRHSYKADYLLHVTDDSWLADSTGREQFFYIARVRAVEARKPLLRIANAGIDGVIDRYGRVMNRRSEREFPTVWDIEVNDFSKEARQESVYVRLMHALWPTDTKN